MTQVPVTKETVSSLAALVGGRVVGDGSCTITGVADLRAAGPEHVGFVRDGQYRAAAQKTAAGALITSIPIETNAAQIIVADVRLAFARVAAHFHPVRRATVHSIHAAAVIADGAEIEAPVEIGAGAYVGRARIGAGTTIMPGVHIGDDCEIGRDCLLYPRVVCYDRVVLGDRVVVHGGTVVGSDGFGYARDGARFVKVPQLGGVRIDDDVEIGANCTIDRGAIGDTRIGARTKIDNLCHVAHNCVIGQDCAFAAATLLAGSTIVGNRVILGGHVIVAGHLTITDDTRVGGNSGVLHDVDKPGDYMGHPLVGKKQHFRTLAALRRLVEIEEEVAALRKGTQDSRSATE
jgi:UDP-3-O-[3-hydroxymyristoyl] glucosamine N-acyltransferase